MGKFRDRTGERNGNLLVIKHTGFDWSGNSVFLCLCDCGKEKEIRGNCLRPGGTRSCGCIKRKLNQEKAKNMRSKKMQSNKKQYIAIKPKHFDYWIWFDLSKVTEEQGKFIGKSGWGKKGASTEIDINSEYVENRIYSDTLQY